MSLVVENGTGIANADSYAELAAAVTYATSFGRSDFIGLSTDDAREIRLREATQFLDVFYEWPSRPLLETQSLQFPRETLTINDREIIGVPKQIVTACVELATFPGLPSLVPDADLSKYVFRSVKVEGLAKQERFRDRVIPRHYWVVEGLLRDIAVSQLAGGMSFHRIQKV